MRGRRRMEWIEERRNEERGYGYEGNGGRRDGGDMEGGREGEGTEEEQWKGEGKRENKGRRRRMNSINYKNEEGGKGKKE